MRRLAILAASGIVATSGLALETPAAAELGLKVGTCVVTGYGSKAVIIGMARDGYKIRFDLTGGTSEQHHAGVKAVPCPADAAGPDAQPAPPTPDRGMRNADARVNAQGGTGGACFASETGGAGLEGSFRGVIRRQFEKQAAAGSDGTTTVRFLNFRMDGGRTATVIDRVNYKPDMRRPVYSVRALLQTCTDYRRATDTRTTRAAMIAAPAARWRGCGRTRTNMSRNKFGLVRAWHMSWSDALQCSAVVGSGRPGSNADLSALPGR
jgi:hypothetical protein